MIEPTRAAIAVAANLLPQHDARARTVAVYVVGSDLHGPETLTASLRANDGGAHALESIYGYGPDEDTALRMLATALEVKVLECAQGLRQSARELEAAAGPIPPGPASDEDRRIEAEHALEEIRIALCVEPGQDPVPYARHLRNVDRRLHEPLRRAAVDLFDNRLGQGEAPERRSTAYAPRELWAALGAKLYGVEDDRVVELLQPAQPTQSNPERIDQTTRKELRAVEDLLRDSLDGENGATWERAEWPELCQGVQEALERYRNATGNARELLALGRDRRQFQVLDWAASTFGDWCREPRERALRFLEEALELVQAAGLSGSDVISLARYTYSRRPGEVPKELGQVAVVLLALAEASGQSLELLERAEVARLLAADRDALRARHARKVEAGITSKSDLLVQEIQEAADSDRKRAADLEPRE